MKFLKLLTLVLIIVLLAVTAVSAQKDEPATGEGITLPILLDGDTYSGEFDGLITGQLLAFNGSEGDSVTISMVPTGDDSTLDPLIVLLGQAGEVLASDDDSGDIPLSSLIEDFELPYAGSYYIVATTYTNLNNEEELFDPRAYDVSLTGNTEPTDLEGYEENTVFFLRGVLEVGSASDGELLATEPVYFITFDGAEGQSLDITLDSDDFDPLLYVFDPNGARIGVNDDEDGLNSALSGLELPQTGTYLLFVTSYGYDDAAESDFDASGVFTLGIQES